MESSPIDELVQLGAAAAQPGDHVVCMSNGSFGGIHAKLLQALATARVRGPDRARS
jgi:UDP-N-acetylmuramate: L-alanyl-gamma-D-glutamyl-meso-diaminopimelate ligase